MKCLLCSLPLHLFKIFNQSLNHLVQLCVRVFYITYNREAAALFLNFFSCYGEFSSAVFHDLKKNGDFYPEL